MNNTDRRFAPVRLAGSVLLSAAVALPAVASAAPPPGQEESRRDLEAKTKLDLSREWAAYGQDQDPEPFADYLDRRFRLRRDVGRGLVMAGGVTFLAGAFALIYGLSDLPDRGRPSKVTGYTLAGITGGLWLVGGILWGINGKRLDKLETAVLGFGGRGRVRLQTAAPILLPRGAGFGVSLAF
ncbi:hypothetical protein OV090_43180 [Nannocystis sp. RBIL2]|uniref:hypothetical protein n=1 Tax=Nannocystis sp. RBIL2 TaxID=2996788 RepID=UPI00226FFB87|nr:hypothetical protein [Nannocystis sp. RBIL2]MCY1071626.1 hypothetical protein [Nannocystis sp. RBIL2]